MTIYHIMYTFHNINNKEMSCARFTIVTTKTLNIVFFNKRGQKNGEGYSPDKNNHHMQNINILKRWGPVSKLLGPARKGTGDNSSRKKNQCTFSKCFGPVPL